MLVPNGPLKFLGGQKGIHGWSGHAFQSRFEVWRVERWHLVIIWNSGKIGWYVTTSGNWADFSWLGCNCKQESHKIWKQFSLKIMSSLWISLFTCCSRYCLPFNRCFLISRVLFWRCSFSEKNSLEAKCLTRRDRGFAMLWMSALHSKVLMCVCELDAQVSANLAVPQVDHCVKEGHFFGWPWICKFDGRMVMVDVFFYKDS